MLYTAQRRRRARASTGLRPARPAASSGARGAFAPRGPRGDAGRARARPRAQGRALSLLGAREAGSEVLDHLLLLQLAGLGAGRVALRPVLGALGLGGRRVGPSEQGRRDAPPVLHDAPAVLLQAPGPALRDHVELVAEVPEAALEVPHAHDDLLDVLHRDGPLVRVLLPAGPDVPVAEGLDVLEVLGAGAPGQVQRHELAAARVALAALLEPADRRGHPLLLRGNLRGEPGGLDVHLQLLVGAAGLPPRPGEGPPEVTVVGEPKVAELVGAFRELGLAGRLLRKQLREADDPVFVRIKKPEEALLLLEAGDLGEVQAQSSDAVAELHEADPPAAVEV
mmetsp:Transcript_112900/g.329975  ORF Transcript_112900/g.329975 Transcript_112900/m.329975 type:complete len:338 (-) Transcript_112900:86-1099(-)